jgi:hypothetical protein
MLGTILVGIVLTTFNRKNLRLDQLNTAQKISALKPWVGFVPILSFEEDVLFHQLHSCITHGLRTTKSKRAMLDKYCSRSDVGMGSIELKPHIISLEEVAYVT